ncbi:MAG TPA: cytochrome C oxidase subunit IV family protein [Rubricoccaceae bacterium]|nr:cytochrome C oxidase subunit IV family protein [Rubricoccaceae bacterium]
MASHGNPHEHGLDGAGNHAMHHVFDRNVLIRTFATLVALTIVTVGLALAERADVIPLGGLSVPVALLIAGAKATVVALFFMGLKYDGGTNAVAFVGSIVFLAIFLAFTLLDTEFRDTFDEQSAVPVDEMTAEEVRLQARNDSIQAALAAQPLVLPPDTALLPGAPTDPAPVASPTPAPATTAPEEAP